MESGRLESRLGPLAWQSPGQGPAVVFFAGAFANHELWRDVVTALQGTHAGPYGGVEATGRPVEVRDTATWHG